MKSRLLGAAMFRVSIDAFIGLAIVWLVAAANLAHADPIQLSGEFIFDAGLYPETFGEDASIMTGSYLILYDPAIATETLYTDYGSGQTSNYEPPILSASIDFAGVKYSTDSTSSLRKLIAVWDEYTSSRDRLNFIIGLGSVSAGYAGITGDDIIYQGVTYRPQNDVSVSPLRTVLRVSLYAEDFQAISSTEIPSASEIEALFSSARSRVEVSSLYGTNGEFRDLGGAITTVKVSVVPSIMSAKIDIKPGSDPNCFNQNGHGVIPVAILGAVDFDVTQIDLATLSFGGLKVRVRGNKGPLCSVEYSNTDEHLDLVCHFEDDSENWEPGDGEATLTGNLLDGTSIEGSDSICVVP